jgi:hypothetical protein
VPGDCAPLGSFSPKGIFEMATKPEDAPKLDDTKKSDVKVRILTAYNGHLPNHVVTLSLTAAGLKNLKEGHVIDDHPDAIGYAEQFEPQPKVEV